MKNKLVSFFLLSIFFKLFSQDAIIKFDKTEVDLGVIDESNANQTVIFNFKNKGSKVLEITDVSTSCGCMVVSKPEGLIKPDSVAQIKVLLNLTNRPGFFNKTITVTSNTKPELTLLTITGAIKVVPRNPEIEFPVKKGKLYFANNGINLGTITNEKPFERSIEVYNSSDKEIVLTDKFNAPSYIKLVDNALVFKPKQVTALKITYDAKLKKDYGFVSDYIELFTNDTENTMIPLSVFGSIEEYFPKLSNKDASLVPKINVSKKEVYLGRYNNGTDIVGSISIGNQGVNKLKILKIKPNCSCVMASMPTDVINKNESILLSFKIKTIDLVGVNNKTIVVFTNDPINPVTVINIKFDIY